MFEIELDRIIEKLIQNKTALTKLPYQPLNQLQGLFGAGRPPTDKMPNGAKHESRQKVSMN